MAVDTIPKLFRERFRANPGATVQHSKDKSGTYQAVSWKEMHDRSCRIAGGLLALGVKRGDHVGIISDNRKEWLATDYAVLAIGAADVPRGSDSMAPEVRYILNHAECALTFAENEAQTEKILSVKDGLPALHTIVVYDEAFDKPGKKAGVAIRTLREVEEKGVAYEKAHPGFFDAEIDRAASQDLATLIYTSGTTGEPKGVMLTHANFLHQVTAPLTPLDIHDGDVFFSILPVWHSFERATEYVAVLAGGSLAYSKPVTQAIIEDMGKIEPMIFPSVPRVWEGIKRAVMRKMADEGGIKYALFRFFLAVGAAYSKLKTMARGLKPQFKRRVVLFDFLVAIIPLILLTPFNALGQVLVFSKIKHRLGGRFRFGVSGAGALPPHVDDFFAAAGILLLEGYGLTEAAPIVSARESRRPVPNTIGPPLPGVEIKILDKDGKELAPGEKGVLYVRGPNVMKGYYKRPEATAAALSADGWLNTGDLAVRTYRNELAIRGRAKETIVLLGGENVEPTPIEDTICESEYVQQAMVVGQDQNHLAALVVPNFERLEKYAKEKGIAYRGLEELIRVDEVKRLIMGDINSLVGPKRGFRLFERVNGVHLLPKVFEQGVEMTNSLKLKRDVISEKYKKEIAALFSK
jgi:long-chain acyl-CoA synthetase